MAVATAAPAPLTKSRRSWSMITPSSCLVDPLELSLRPLHRVLGLHALDALGEHVRDDVLGVDLPRLGIGGPRVPDHPRAAPRVAIGLHGLVDGAPQRVVLPVGRRAHVEAVLDLEPLAELLLGVDVLQEFLGRRTVFESFLTACEVTRW